MIFPYVRHKVDPSLAIPLGEVARPEVPIRVIGPHGIVELSGLIDTGSDHVFMPIVLAELLGLDVGVEPAEAAEGAGGHELNCGRVKSKLRSQATVEPIAGARKLDLSKVVTIRRPRILAMWASWNSSTLFFIPGNYLSS